MRQFGTFAEPSYRHVNIVASGSTRTFLLTSFAGQDQRLTSCFKLLLFLYCHHENKKKKKRNKQTLFESIDGVTSPGHSSRSRRSLPCGARVLQFPPHVHAVINVMSQAKRAKFKSFLPCPLPPLGVFSMTHNSVFPGSFF